MNLTRTPTLWICAICLSLTLAACASGGAGDPSLRPNAPELTFEQFVAQALRDEERGIWIVDGDTPVRTLDEMREIYNNIGRTRRVYGNEETSANALSVNTVGGRDDLWDETTRRNLSFCVSTEFGGRHDQVVDAMVQAGGAWSAAADVRFVHLAEHDANCQPGNGSVLFDVRPVSSGGEFLAAAFFPSWPRNQRTVQIDGSAFSASGPVDLTGVLRHELGHVLGFRHEHTRPEAGTCFEDDAYRPLTPYDRDSVMHYPQCNGNASSTLTLTALDAEGVRGVYGSSSGTTPSDPTPTPSDPSDPTDPGTPSDPSPTPSDPSPTPPTSGCKTASATIAQGESHIYPPLFLTGNVSVTLSGSGDPDLFAWVIGTLDVCISQNDGPSESCSLSPNGEPLFVEVYGYTAGSYRLEVCQR